MTQKHIIEVEGGPYDGELIDLADTLYQETHNPLPWELFASMYGIPIYKRPDGRRYIKWSDLEALDGTRERVAELERRWANRPGRQL